MTIAISQCVMCKHFDRDRRDGEFCSAFHEGIPRRIYNNQHDHRTHYPGDNGTRFEPLDEDAARIVDAMFRDDADD